MAMSPINSQGLDAHAKVVRAFHSMEQWLGGSTVKTEHIAQGPSSTVYKLYSGRFNSDVAMKLVNTTALPPNYESTFLQREIEICQSIRHPFICHTFGVYQPHKTLVAFVFEYYHGGTMLDMILKKNKIPENQSAVIFRQLIEALRYLHEMNIVHRDVKLENILFDNFGNVKLADFGFARRMHSKLQRSKSFCGTKPYSCPDVVMRKEYDPYANDWYSLGVVLYTSISGRWPYNLQDIDEVTKGGSWPHIWYPPELFSPEAAELLHCLLNRIAYMRPDYHVCLTSPFMKKYGQGIASHPIVRGPYNALA
ncbi:unnamed protein product [Bursaphelenchus okinawaensis]|uniref:Protein kinase domain-containing protein n=1 Tax=Bursaphelenchus okinawaensis TaxID=465554 RepID=A0A811LAC2_9BILA|nr:unnamed protein product [Bursaphelenchus okinawaensis]CAG9120685.1 unnamed protein product [Bursaphelenchus okinawaensis]